MTNMDSERKLADAILLLKVKFPFHADLLARAKVALDSRIRTACVFPSGRILLSPAFIADMTHIEVAFIIEHEIMHIYYKTNERSKLFYDHRMANKAHDLIINGELVERFGFERPPKGGLHWPDYEASVDFLKRQGIVHQEFKPVKEYSLEEMVALLTTFRKNIHSLPRSVLNALARVSVFQKVEEKKEEQAEKSPNHEVWDALDQLLDKSKGKVGACKKTMTETSASAEETPSEPMIAEEPPSSPMIAEETPSGPVIVEETPSEPMIAEEPPSSPMSAEEIVQREWLGESLSGDAMSSTDELELFPSDSPLGITGAEQEMEDLVRTVAVRNETIDLNEKMAELLQNGNSGEKGGSGASSAGLWDVQILKGRYSDSWEMALQAWIDESAPPTRSWARASRRGANRTDVVLPGRNRLNEDWMLNIILDVSGSMWDELPAVLGHIQAFGMSAGVRQVRLVESVEDCRIDNIMDISELSQYKMPLAEGSDLCPCMLKLAEDPSVETVLVLTDGYIEYPPAEDIPYNVVWALTDMAPEDFEADYGLKIAVHLGGDD